LSGSIGKVVFITGSGRRLGRQLAYAFADAGYDVVLHAHSSVEGMKEAAERISASGKKVFCVQGDLAGVPEIRRIAEEVLNATPRLDVLVNNAGIFPVVSFEETTEELWDQTLNVNTRSMFFLTQALAPALRSARGNVVNIASLGGLQAWKSSVPYSVSKAGVIMLTRSLAKILAPDICVNALAPGVITIQGEEQHERISPERIPMQKYGTVRDLADAALFLAATRYITGHILPVDGGAHSLSL
jgi:NAD(P)-dependent dehydrogenase (short-subunit alcohol dehydrogenase family)